MNENFDQTSPSPDDAHARQVKRRILRAGLRLGVGVGVLVLVVAGFADLRRRTTAMAAADHFAQTINRRQGDSRLLPLSFHLSPESMTIPRGPALTPLTHGEARLLRRSSQPVLLVAHTFKVRGLLAPDGYAVVVFEAGRLRAEWASPERFETLSRQRRDELVSIRAPQAGGDETP